MDENEQSLMKALASQVVEDLPEHVAKAKGDGSSEQVSEDMIITALKTVQDPEIMINIYDMGLIYKIDQKENGDVFIDMTVTSPMCPVAGILPQQAADAVALISGINSVEVKVVWEPFWTPDRMSDEAKASFELF